MSATTSVDTTVSAVDSISTGVPVQRRLTRDGVSPYDMIEWVRGDVVVKKANGDVIFEQYDIEVPDFWTANALQIAAEKYFQGHVGHEDRETSVKQLIDRVVDTIAEWGLADGYFEDVVSGSIFREELRAMMINQVAAFNSPVWFNVGVVENPQCSACFIQSVDDSMESIMQLQASESILFKGGSGTGSNLSGIRSSKERLSGRGFASGPVSFMRGYDSWAGSMKSGGKTRRAAKMVILNVDHPDIRDYISTKVDAERQAHALIDMGWSTEFNDPRNAYAQVPFQNANHSVRVTDNFMEAVQTDGTYMTKLVTTGKVHEELSASLVWNEIAEAAWLCGDPGLQFDDIINDWHTCPASGKQNATNPCSEFLFLDDTACNLASINLMKFRQEDGSFDVDGFRHAVDILFLAQEILVDRSTYPTGPITKNSHLFRPLGLGFSNLGAFLMSNGMPYDSDEGRSTAAAITAIMGGRAYRRSAEIAETKGPFEMYEKNASPMLRVIRKHRQAAGKLKGAPKYLVEAAKEDWSDAVSLGKDFGFRNSQATLLAPTGTISFLMDCDTTGIEPDISLVKSKKLVGGGEMKIDNLTVPLALETLGYSDKEIHAILDHMEEKYTIEGAPGLKDEHLPVFDCALKPAAGMRSIAPLGHIKMMAAVQPFLSGAISKTVNMPNETTVDEIKNTYLTAWELGLKTIALYRDGCKKSQPLNTKKKQEEASDVPVKIVEVKKPLRRRLPDTRNAINHKFTIDGYEGYVNIGMYESGMPGEIFITMAKQGSTINGLMDAFATSLSIGLQHQVPLSVYVEKFQNMRFEPQGLTTNKDIRTAHSVMDYIAKYLRMQFPQCFADGEDGQTIPDMTSTPQPGSLPVVKAAPENGVEKKSNGVDKKSNGTSEKKGFTKTAAGPLAVGSTDAPFCRQCGNQMVPLGGCHFCYNCKDSSSCG